MASIAHDFLPAEAAMPSDRQRLFVLFFTGTLIDLVILGLFDEFSANVHVESFSIALLAAIVLQILLKLTIAIEHRVLAKFKGKAGAAWTALKFFVAWLILFGSKFVILEVLARIFSHRVRFEGWWHGIIWVIVVAVTMVVVEELIVRFYRKIA
jgi:hypothetical protein